jgi:hypothetical protein
MYGTGLAAANARPLATGSVPTATSTEAALEPLTFARYALVLDS